MCSTTSLLSARSGSDCVVRMNTIFFLDRDLDNSSSKDLTPPLFLAKCKFYRTRLRAVSAANGATAGGGGPYDIAVTWYNCYIYALFIIYMHTTLLWCAPASSFEEERRYRIFPPEICYVVFYCGRSVVLVHSNPGVQKLQVAASMPAVMECPP